MFKRVLRIIFITVIIFICLSVNLNNYDKTEKVTVVSNGSTALLPVTLNVMKEYKRIDPYFNIVASGDSSMAGIQALYKNSAQLAACDWDVSKYYKNIDLTKDLIAHKVAKMPYATIVNKNQSIDNLTTEQLQKIFTGKIINWQEIGGEDAPIVIVNRQIGSGTRINYEKIALKGIKISKGNNNYYKEVQTSGEMFKAISNNENAIGYIDMGYIKDDVKSLKYNGIEAKKENIINGKYDLWEYGYYITKGKPQGKLKHFLNYVQSKECQEKIINKLNFIPINS